MDKNLYYIICLTELQIEVDEVQISLTLREVESCLYVVCCYIALVVSKPTENCHLDFTNDSKLKRNLIFVRKRMALKRSRLGFMYSCWLNILYSF